MNDKIKITIRKALASDIDAVAAIYDRIHTWEEKGKVTIGWERGVYPERITAETALAADELFVMEEAGVVVGTGIINQTQVDVYEKGNWKHPAEPTEVMVLHTLVIDPEVK
ncbi:MAG: GNAT family N-acetyltransferase, partial [Firmicutes bacterium]|nr:GNAT family N-acetyltransferase [Bacillota bacterium]